MPVDIWRAPRSSVVGLDPGIVCDRLVPHSWRCCSYPHAPHARLLKHWEGQIVSLLALVRHPHVHHKLAFFSSFARLHPLLARFSRLLLVFFLLPWLSFTPLSFASAFLSLLSPPLSSPECTSNRFISPGRLHGSSPTQAHPAPLAHGYHDDPCTLKKAGVRARERMLLRKNEGGLQSSRKNIVEEK